MVRIGFIKKILSIMVVIFLGCSISVEAQSVEKTLPSGTKYENIGNKIEQYVKENKETTVGMAVSVFERDNIVYKNNFGYADKENGYAVDDKTVFEWGSVSKALVWVSVMQLWEQEKIDFNADIKTYLPEGFLNNLSYDESITMINLMNHNAGFQDMLVNLFVHDRNDIVDFEMALQAHEPEQVYKPGTVTSYSNWSTALAAYIVQRISGMPYDEYVKENIFKPLGMENTSIAVDQCDNTWVRDQRKNLQCYTYDGELIPNCFYYIPLYPVGACIGTIKDLTTFVQSILPTEGGKSPLFKKHLTLQEMMSPTAFYGDTNIAYNCHGYWTQEYGVSVVGHGGNTAGCSANILINQDSGLGVVVMTNQKDEQVYNYDMMELIFGGFKNSSYARYNKNVTNDYFMNARTIIQGPLSIKSILDISQNSDEDLNSFWVYSNRQGVSKIVWPYDDLVEVGGGELVFIAGIVLFMALGIVYSFITLICGGCIITPIKRRKAKMLLRNTVCTFRKWNYIACALEILLFANILILFYQVSIFQPCTMYLWQIVLMGILGILMTSYVVWLIISWKKLQCSRREKVKYVVTAIFMIVSVVLILYYDM